MSLAPYYVLWAFTTAAMALITLGMVWMVFKSFVSRLFSRLWMGDFAFYWLFFAALHHTLFFGLSANSPAIRTGYSIWALWGFIAGYLMIRFFPLGKNKGTILLFVSLVAWSASIGAGTAYITDLEMDRDRIAASPGSLLSSDSIQSGIWQRAWMVTGIPSDRKEIITSVLERIRKTESFEPELVGLVKVTLIPYWADGIYRDLSKLKTYQILQIILAASLLLAWGFGSHPQIT